MHKCIIYSKRPIHYNFPKKAVNHTMYRKLNKNPAGRNTTDCVIRALSKTMGESWLTIYDAIYREARGKYDMMDANHVWIEWAKKHGFRLYTLPNSCPECYTVKDFCRDHPRGTYILGTGTHAIAVINGDWYDTFDSGDLVPIFYLWSASNGI